MQVNYVPSYSGLSTHKVYLSKHSHKFNAKFNYYKFDKYIFRISALYISHS